MIFSDLVLKWRERGGRRDLPWQQEVTGYRVWVSEIMLQQTRVGTVTEYFQRFMVRFPRVRDLALAEPDEVLHLWSGLGYYARARNLHSAARIIHERHGGEFPSRFDAVLSLPGIGRSTAGAILALAFGQRHAILDGNVKRVLSRYHAIAGWPGGTMVARQLWALAERYTPHHRVAEYTQAMMDLGALVCTPTLPACPHCPLSRTCRAYAEGQQEDFPTKRMKKPLPVRTTRFILVVRTHGTARPPMRSVLLERRPATGVWGGLWSFPECALEEDFNAWCATELGGVPTNMTSLPPFRHTFTHFHLDIHPILLSCRSITGSASRTATISPFDDRNDGGHADGNPSIWYPLDESSISSPPLLGFAAPVARLLDVCRATLRQGSVTLMENP